MFLSTILPAFLKNTKHEHETVELPLPSYKPEYFVRGDMVINDETGQCAIIENIVDSPYYNDDRRYAFVIGVDVIDNSTYSSFWTFEQMSLWIPAEKLGVQ